MTAPRTFANDAQAVATARRFVVDQLGDVARHTLDEIAIMVSELATNCVRHTDSEFTVNVEHSGNVVRVEVADAGSGVPTVRTPDSSELSGRGLRIVQELADSFGVEQSAEPSGKTVWFVVDLEQHARHSEDARLRP